MSEICLFNSLNRSDHSTLSFLYTKSNFNFLLVILSPSTLLFFPSPRSPPLTNWYDYFYSSLRLSVQIGIISRHSGLLLLSDVGDVIDLRAEQLAEFSSTSVGIKSVPSSAPSSRTIIYPSFPPALFH